MDIQSETQFSAELRLQAKRLTAAYHLFERKRRQWNVEGVNWYAWQDWGAATCSWCSQAGLLTEQGAKKPAFRAFTRLTR